MQGFDLSVISFLNQFAHRSSSFDELVFLIGSNYLLKTGVLAALLYWLWFTDADDNDERRRKLLFGLVATTIALIAARILSFILPFRERPLRNPDLHFVLPYLISPNSVLGWNSMPSDNSVLFFGMAATILLVSRRAGWIAFAHSFVVVAFARVYLGLHYPTDILVGAAIGIAAVSLVRVRGVEAAVTGMPMRWLHRHPQSFYTTLLLLIFFMATSFEPFYPLAHIVARLGRHIADP